MISCVEIQTEGANGGLSQASHQFFFEITILRLNGSEKSLTP